MFDEKLRVKFTNAAFRRFFADGEKGKGTLQKCIGCKESALCGQASSCRYCAFYKTMQSAVESGVERTETVHTERKRQGRTDRLSMNIRVLPIAGTGGLFLGLTEGKYQTEMERELLSAQKMQQRLLPAGKSVGGVSYAYTYIPCQGIGGDLPDVYELDGQTYGVLSDVSGHGISAGMLATFVKAGLDRQEKDLARALEKLNEKFNELGQDERAYITVIAARIDKAAGVFRYASAGHNAPLLLKNEYGINEIEAPAPPISNWLGKYAYTEREMPFERGDILVMLTDGATECANSAGEQFGIERVESVLMQSRSAEDFIGKLKSALTVFCGGKFTDDITAVAFDL